MTDGLTDQALLLRVAQGDAKAFRLFYERHERSLWLYVRSILSADDATQDVMQEVFSAVLKDAGSFAAAEIPRAYLLGVARRQCLMKLRRQGRRQQALRRTLVVRAETESPSAAVAAADAEETRRLNDCLEKLPVEQKELVVLHDFESLSFRDMSKVMGLTLAQVYASYQSALSTLRNMWEGSAHE